ncbi:MAG: hypothetical protein JWR63_1680 [Conexibacter sp.]|nr:hypothetical protein [Conexibacter sp.]
MPVLEGDQWEKFCVEALEYRHRDTHAFQKVPARHRGDYGLDGYLHGNTLFQCYGDQAGTSSTARAEAQKRKLDTDLPKLKRNGAPIKALVGTGVRHYVFLVSQLNDKSVVEHATTWKQTVCGWQLEYLTDSFVVHVKDIDYLKVEWDLLYGALKQKLSLMTEEVDEAQVRTWREAENELIVTLRRKLSHIAGERIDEWDDRLVRWRLGELDRMTAMRSHGQIWQRIREVRAAREGQLNARSLASDPGADVLALADGYTRDLLAEIASLQHEDAGILAWGAIADWLMRCPLDYGS